MSDQDDKGDDTENLKETYRNNTKSIQSIVKDNSKKLAFDFAHEIKRNFNSHFTKEVFLFLYHSPELQVNSESFNSGGEHLINVKNGVLDLKKSKLKEHSPKYMFNYTLQVNFKEEDDYREPKM